MKWSGLIISALVAAVLFAGCEGDSNTTVISPEDQTIGITVSGKGEVTVTPDVAVFSVGVEVRSASVGDARERAAQLAAAVIASVKGNGVKDADVQTASLYVQPEYNYPTGGGQPTIVGYIVTNLLSVKVRDLGKLSETIDEALDAGGDAARLQGVSFQVDDDADAKKDAREKAMADARAKAAQLADLGEVKLGEPLAISEVVQGAVPVDLMTLGSDDRAGAVTQTPIEAGSGTVRVDLVVRWAIAK